MDKIEVMQAMLKNDPENGLAWYLLGVEYVEAGRDSDALYAFSNALTHCGSDFKEKVFEQLSRLTQGKGSPPNKAKTEEELPENELTEEELMDEEEEYEEEEYEEEYEECEEDEEPADDEDDEEKVVRLRVVHGGKGGADVLSETREQQTVTFEQVGGYEDLKDVIRMKIIKPFSSQSLFSKFKKKTGGGILMYGPPGCGKTFMAKATAGECRARFQAVHITDILDPYLGVSSQNIKDIFQNARAKSPCVLFFDEIDTIGFNRAKLASEHMRPIIDQFLTEIEGIDTNTQNMLIIGATNMPWDVDPAFKRPGRFDKVLFVPPPDKKARVAILQLKMAGRPQETIDYDTIAEKTELYSGADLENLIETATEYVITEIMKTEIERPISTKDLLRAVEATRPSTIEWLKTIKNYLKYSNQTGLYDDVEKYLSKRSRYL
ncbi:AAA family ATPase [Gorillibacterium sp. CAU 1737]|uniref:AAA family ATPase n=1 Tax=Gorillibacterium sp. CAU 1737 TaxID=3140362 RepID=UPI003260ED5F